MNKIESRCGIECSKCENKGFENCGFCPDFSCELLNSFAYDK